MLLLGHRRVEKSAATFVKDYLRRRHLILLLIVSFVMSHLLELKCTV